MFFFIYHGFGWAVLLIPAIFYGAFEVILNVMDVDPKTAADLRVSLAFICASVPCWFLGRYCLRYRRAVTDKETGAEIMVPQPYHALFWIPMHWWGPIFLVLGVFLLIYDAQHRSPLHPMQTPILALATQVSQKPQTVFGGTLKYSITLPPAWEYARDHEHFDIFIKASNGSGSYWMGVYVLDDSKDETDGWSEMLMRDLGTKTGAILERYSTATIDSKKWAVINGTMQDHGTPLTCKIYAYAGQNAAYAMLLVATPANWTAHGTELMSIARSFKFPSQ